MTLDISLKKVLHDLCTAYAAERVEIAKKAMDDLRESMDEETKNATGDKYETGRSMIQIEMERVMGQLAEAQKLKQALEFINPKLINNNIAIGSLVETSNGYYYISIPLGKLTHEGKDYFAISPTSPIGIVLMDKVVGESVNFNGRQIAIKQVI